MGEVIYMNNKNWKERIDKVAADYEKELDRKKETYRQTGDSEVFTPEDIDAMLGENEMFHGKNLDFSQVQKFNKLAEAAKWLDSKHGDVVKIDCPPLPKGRAGYICMDIKGLSFFNSEETRRHIAGMILMCDSFTVSGLDDGVVHLNFAIRDIRTN